MSEREKQRKRVAERITEALDIPPDILSGESLIEIRGRGSVVVHGCRRILVYLPERIELSLHRGGVAIEGEGMCFVSFSAGSVGIEGENKGSEPFGGDMRQILLFIAGYEELRVHREGSAAVSDICMRRGYICREARFEGEYYYFRCTLLCARGLKRICKERGIEIEVARRVGVPALMYRYRHRYGVVAGALLFLFIVFFSGRVIWDIRVDGNSRLEDGEVIEALGECGLSIGDIKSEIDTATVENVLMIRSEDISWISINLIGTVAEVEIREREVAEELPDYDAANIVAGEDGEIVLFEDVRGNIVLNIGDRVRRGELIVSGIYESVGGPLRYTVAKGGVLARCEREIIAEIPFAYEKKVYTGRVFVEKYLVFFEKEIKFYSNCRNLYTSCDKIDTVEYADVLSQGELPVGVRTVRYLEYTYETCRRDETQAQALAEYKLSCELGTLAKDAELISKRVERYVHEDRFAIVCRVECIRDIAEVRKIEIDITP